MALIQYPIFYRQHGIRRPDQLIKPPLSRLEFLDLPRNSIYHYLGTGPLDDGPTESENALKNTSKVFSIETVWELTSFLGNPRKLPIDVLRLARNHRVKNPRFRPLRSLEAATRDPLSVVVYNYSYIHRMYKYMRNYYTSHYRWHNLMATVFSKVAELSVATDRHQFIEFDIPKILPSLSQLRKAETNLDQRTARFFTSSETIILLQMWQWLGHQRETSILGKIPRDRLERINLIFRESGKWFVVNLGQLDAWRKPTKEELEKDNTLSDKGLPADLMQKRFLRLTMSLFEARNGQTAGQLDELLSETAAPTPAAPHAGDVAGVPETAQAPQEVSQQPAIQDDAGNDAFEPDLDKEPEIEETFGVTGDDLSNISEIEDMPDISAQIDADLEKLEDIGQMELDEETDGVVDVFDIDTVIPTGQTLEDAIIRQCNALADAGGLSAAEYRKYLEAASTYKKIVAPDGTTMDKFIEVPKEVVVVKESASIPDKKTVVDKTMLKSSLLEFDEKYVKEVMQKDIAAMVLNLQNAGIIVQDYQVEEYEDVSIAYNSYTIKVKPLQGASSTLRFRIPKVQSDGTFKVNGVNYRTRKQRGDGNPYIL